MTIAVTPLVQATKAQWQAQLSPILSGRLVYESDTGNYKVGDGVSTYSQLSYTNNPTGADNYLLMVELADLVQPFVPSVLDPVQTLNTLNTLSANYSSLASSTLAATTLANANAASIATLLAEVATLNGQITASSTGLFFAGAWDALANNPHLTSSAGTAGALYIVSVANNNIALNNITSVNVGDEIIFSPTTSTWIKIAGNSTVVQSVVGLAGIITASQIAAALGLTSIATAQPTGPGLSVANGFIRLNFGSTTGLVADGYALATEVTRATTEETNLGGQITALAATVTANATANAAATAAAQTKANAALPNTTAALLTLINSLIPLLPTTPVNGTPALWLDGNFLAYS